MCRVLGVSTSGYYEWRTRPPSARAVADGVVTEMIRDVHRASRRTYGYRRVRAALRDDDGLRIGKGRVARLMRREGSQGVTRRRFRRTTVRDEDRRPAPDLLDRDFTAPAPDRRWCADSTYVRTPTGWLFLSVVMDLFSRRIVGWAAAPHMRTELVTHALRMALARRRPEGVVVHHSHQGSQYVSYDFERSCRQAGVARSMGSVGDWYDNATVEPFFATLKCELLDREAFRNRTEARFALHNYIEGFYNRTRRHSLLGNLSPVGFERRWRAHGGVGDAA